MNKSVLNGVISQVKCSKMKSCDVDLVPKPKMEALKGFQTLECYTGDAVGVCCKDPSNGVQIWVPTPAALSHVGGHMEDEMRSSPALRGSGNAFSLPLFNGTDNREFVSWLHAIDCCFGVNDFSEHEKCDMVVSCLRNDALKWYNAVACAKNRNGVFKFKYWHKLKCCLKEKYLNKAVMFELRNEFQNLKLDSLCVKDYAMLFKELYFICGNPNDSSKKISLFYNGLSSEIQDWIDIEQISSFNLVYELALISERLIHEHEVSMESLAKNNVKHAAFLSFSKGLGYEVPLTYGVTFGDKGTVLVSVLGTVIVQRIGQDLKLSHEPDFDDIGWLDLRLGSQDTKNHPYVDVNDPWFHLESNPKGLNVNGDNLEVPLHLADYEVCASSSDFPWECWPSKGVVGITDESTPSKGRLGVKHVWLLMEDKIEHFELCASHDGFESVGMELKHDVMTFDPGGTQTRNETQIHVHLRTTRMQQVHNQVCCKEIVTNFDVLSAAVLMRPRYFIVIFDPGGMDVKPCLEVAFKQVSLNLLNSFKEVHNKLVMIYLLSIKSWCGFWSLIIVKFEDKFLLNLGSLQQELRYGCIIFQSNHGKMLMTILEEKPLRKGHENRTFCFDFRIMIILFAPYLEFYLVKFCDLYMVQFLENSSLIWFWNQPISLSKLLTMKPQRLSHISASGLRKTTCQYKRVNKFQFCDGNEVRSISYES